MMWNIIILFVIAWEHTGFAKEMWIDPHDNVADDTGGHQNWAWHDPHDLGIDDLLSDTNADKESCSTRQTNYSNVYLKRLINLILNSANVATESNLPVYSGKLSMNLEKEDYMFLKEYADNYHEECIISLQKIDTIFAKGLMKSSYEEYADLFSSLGDHLYNIIFNKLTIGLSLIVFSGIFVYKLVKTNSSLWFIIKGISLLAYVIDFATTYLHLIEAEEIKNIVDIKKGGSVPPECDPTKMTWSKYFSYMLKSESDCLQYYKATYQNLYYLVTPLKVVNHQFEVIIVGPIISLGTALGAFTHNIMDQLPWGLNIILLPLLLLFVCLIIMILCAAFFKCPIKLKVFPFIGFEFGSDHGKKIEGDSLSGNNLESVLFSHRKVCEVQLETKQKEINDTASTTEKLALKSTKEGIKTKKSIDKNKKIINGFTLNNNIQSTSHSNVPETKELINIPECDNKNLEDKKCELNNHTEDRSAESIKEVIQTPPDDYGDVKDKEHISDEDSDEEQPENLNKTSTA